MLHGAGIFTYIWVIYGANVAKYTSTMDHLGKITTDVISIFGSEIDRSPGGFQVANSIFFQRLNLVLTSPFFHPKYPGKKNKW